MTKDGERVDLAAACAHGDTVCFEISSRCWNLAVKVLFRVIPDTHLSLHTCGRRAPR